jgi:hypothetical protein
MRQPKQCRHKDRQTKRLMQSEQAFVSVRENARRWSADA